MLYVRIVEPYVSERIRSSCACTVPGVSSSYVVLAEVQEGTRQVDVEAINYHYWQIIKFKRFIFDFVPTIKKIKIQRLFSAESRN